MTDEAIEIRGIEERIRQFQNLATDNPVMGQRIREAIKATLRIVQKQLQSEAHTGLDMKSDPRKAYKAVRMAVYRKIFGGQVNILSKRKVGIMHFYAPPRKLDDSPNQRGGNRRKRSERTTTMMSYQGSDRGMILRWLNDGTYESNPRSTRYGSRGSIAPRGWFGRASHADMELAAERLDKIIDDIIKGIIK